MLILSNVEKLYDGTGAGPEAVHSGVDLLIDGARVHACEPHRPDRPVAEDDTVVDASGLTVTPGLVDCHGHVTVLGIASEDLDKMNTGGALLYVEKVLHRTLVDGGVTTMRDVGGATHLMKRMVDEGVMIGPRLKISICMLSSTGGHADFRGPDRCHAEVSRLWPPGPGRPGSVVDGPWECRKRVREIAACGADLIKICSSPGVASPSDHLEHREFTPEEVAAICEEAGARGLSVAAHAHSRSGIALGIEHGVRDLQHISFLDEELTAAAAARGCSVTPTSWIMEELLQTEGLDPFVLEKAKKAADNHRQAVQFAATGDLPILAGTDPVLPGMHGRNYMELVHLMRDGVSTLRTWHGATGLAAAKIGQEDAGELVAGKRADLLVARGDVVEDPELFDRGALVEVFKDGVGHRGGLAGVPQRGFDDTVGVVLDGGA
jgi:imidazolonepropionase-like amidohydrolase